jgi:hypothetical protein
MNDSFDLILLRTIALEIFKDGGATFIHFLPNYNPQISTLLKKSKTKLVPFLQKYPSVFEIIENNGNFDCCGHDVVQLMDCSVVHDDIHPLLEERTSVSSESNCLLASSNLVMLLEKKLTERTLYELRKRRVKLLKRQSDKHVEENGYVVEEEEEVYMDKGRGNGSISNTRSSENSPDGGIPGAQLQWLTNKVKKELHEYIRSLPIRPTGVLPFSHQWFTEAMALYLSFLEDTIDTWIEDDACLLYIEQDDVDCNKKENIGRIRIYLKSSKMAPLTKDMLLESLDKIANRIKFILENNGPAVGGIDLGRLMSDRTLRRLTNGEDVRTMIHENPDLFRGIRVFRDNRRTKTGAVNDDSHSWYIEFNRTILNKGKADDRFDAEKRLLAADDVGSFSLTSRRVAIAMANLLLRACIHGPLGFTKNNDCKVVDPVNGIGQSDKEVAIERGMICIDLTAGVGGNVIAFGKVYSHVYAFEIDQTRADLLQRNIDSFMEICDREKIIVQCQDSIQGIAKLASELRANESRGRLARISVFIDPPFGGVYYRSKNAYDGSNLCLGENMPLKRVVATVSSLLSPVTIGLKLPLIFDVRSFAQQLEVESSSSSISIDVKVVLIKKIERQLFVILQS